MPEVLDLVSSGKLHAELVTGRRVGWEDAAEALVDVDLKLVISRLESTA